MLLIDHRDSFTHNIAQLLATVGAAPRVLPAAGLTRAAVLALRPDRIVLGPGPGPPERATLALDLLRDPPPGVPLLGICLGHQALALAHGGRVVRVEPVHGHAHELRHAGRGLFEGLPSPLIVGRYHSLAVEPGSVPAELEVTATADDGTVMGLAHRRLPQFGVQFHPESILSTGGAALLSNFLAV